MHDEPEKKKKGLKLTRKSTRKIIGKWRKLSSEDLNLSTSATESIDIDDVTPSVTQVLGLPMAEAVAADPSLDGIPLPSFFRYSIDFVEENGLGTEGIYRLSPPKSRLDELERRANSGEKMVFADPHDAAGLIKRFLRQIPEPVVPPEFDVIAESCTCGLATSSLLKPKLVCTCGAARQMREELNKLTAERKTLFVYVFLHAQHVMGQEKENKMGLQALGLLLQTVLEMSRKMVCFSAHAIRPCDGIVVPGACYLVDEDTRIIKYVPPIEGHLVEKWLESTHTSKDLQEELSKQQFLLDLLHSKISARHQLGFTTLKLDEHLWQVQNSITAIKRRLKHLIESTPQVVPLDTSSDIRCIEMYEEKQLMATQGMLREDILEEKQKIARLLWQLEMDRSKDTVEKDSEDVDDDDNDDGQEEWAERCKLEEEARSTLLEEIIRLRSSCVDLRARLELESLSRDLPNYNSL